MRSSVRTSRRTSFTYRRDDLDLDVWVEAVTANPSGKYAEEPEPKTPEEKYREMHEVIPIRLEHIKGIGGASTVR